MKEFPEGKTSYYGDCQVVGGGQDGKLTTEIENHKNRFIAGFTGFFFLWSEKIN